MTILGRTGTLTCLMTALLLAPGAAGAEDDPPSEPQDVIREVLERNRDLGAIDAEIQAAEHVVPQAGAMPDPVFMVGLSNWPLSSDESPLTGVQFDLKQTFPWFGKLDAREAVAERAVAVQRSFQGEMEIVFQARARILLWELTYLAEHRKLAEEIGRVLEQFGEVTEAAYIVGTGRQQDLIKPAVERIRIEDVIVGIDRKANILVSEINALRNRPPATPVQAYPIPEQAGTDALDRERLLDAARRNNPRLHLQKMAVAKQHEALRVAEKDYFPDITIGLQYRVRWVETGDAVNGADFFGVTLGFNLPIWAGSKQSERVEEVNARIRSEQARHEGAWNRIRDRVEAAAQRIEKGREQARLFREGVIPDTERALDSSLADYQAGRLEFLSVLDNVLKLFRARVDLLRRTVDIQIAEVTLERYLGGPLEYVGKGDTP